MRDYGLDMVMLSAKGTGGDSSPLHALLPFFHRVLDRKAEQTAIGLRSSHSRTHHTKLLPAHTTAAYQRKSGSGRSPRGSGNGYGDERGWDGDGLDGVEQREGGEEEDGGGMTIDMGQLDMLSAYNASHTAAAHSATPPATRYLSPATSYFATPSSSSPSSASRTLSSSSARHSSPLSRLLPSGLFGLGGKKDDKQARARV
ncbi:hypothetical protein MMC34_008443 [Xylographa carneopallida]|nr:hypothetical protein [Xylographa carneopallida]